LSFKLFLEILNFALDLRTTTGYIKIMARTINGSKSQAWLMYCSQRPEKMDCCSCYI